MVYRLGVRPAILAVSKGVSKSVQVLLNGSSCGADFENSEIASPVLGL